MTFRFQILIVFFPPGGLRTDITFALPKGLFKSRGWWRRTCADMFEVPPPSFTGALHSVQYAFVLSTCPSLQRKRKNSHMGAFPFGFATNFSWLSAMLDASSSGGMVLVIMSPVQTGFSFFFRTNQFFEP